GRIELVVEQRQGEVHVTVRDDGVGIAPQHSGKLFQPYFTTKKNGTGLGLFVTRKLIEDNSGAVEFESQARGGTIFRVRLPVG
ncbi:MAG TPA: ATP-binding protein, partial [Gemmataceae bacterium]|nr:ATP-binding protein [Gemmataceae bacterium]